MALACRPELVIADEPVTALDVMIQAQIMELIRDLSKKYELSMIMISHDLSVLAELCDQIAIMYAGKVVEYGDAKEVFRNPKHPYTVRLMNSFPDIYGERTFVHGIPGYPPSLLHPPKGCSFYDRCTEKNEKCKESEMNIIKVGGKPLLRLRLPDIGEAMNEENRNLIEIRDLEVTFQVRNKRMKKVNRTGLLRAVDKVTLDIRKGETLAVVGESGCGKTTLGKAILNIVKPTAGEIHFEGINPAALSKSEMQAMRDRMQLIFQDPYESLNPRQNILKTLTEPLAIHRKELSEEEKNGLIRQYLEAVGLHSVENVLERYPHHLSGRPETAARHLPQP